MSVLAAFPRRADCGLLRHIGLENELAVDCRHDDHWNDSNALPSKLVPAITKRGLFQSVGWDGGGREFRTNPISLKALYQVRGERYLKEYYEELRQTTRTVESGGTHIHISVLDKDNVNLEANAMALSIAFFSQFQKIAGRQTAWARRPEAHSMTAIRTWLTNNWSNRHAPAARPLYYRSGFMLTPTQHQTLEFRGPQGSNDAHEVLAWVEFLQNVVKAANRNSVNGSRFGDLLKGKRIEAYVEGLEGWRTLTEADLNATVNIHSL